ncbi:MAG: hypothetical protein NUK65_12780 [Firmicutes bacterium]|nr:hypothetical protein [Bacillota bacterium]
MFDGSSIEDSPGFSQLELVDVDSSDIRLCFPEFAPFALQCRFKSCTHANEPGCAVKEAVESEQIALTRYENYLFFVNEVKQQERSF